MKTKTSWVAIVPDLLLICLIIGLFTIWKKLIKILTTKLEVTGKTVSGKTGLIHTQTLDSPISKVTSVKVEQGLFGKILNYGNIYINTPAGNFQFGCISKPNEFKDYLLSKMS